MALEEEAIPTLRDGIAQAESVRDYVSRDLFLQASSPTRRSMSIISRKQFDLIKLMGIANYVQLQSKPANEESASTGD